MSEYKADVEKYTSDVSDAHIDAIVKYLGIALQNKDSSLVAVTDKAELDRIRDGFAAKKLELSADEADKGIAAVSEKMKGVNQKSRVTFYYLLAEETGTLGKLA